MISNFQLPVWVAGKAICTKTIDKIYTYSANICKLYLELFGYIFSDVGVSIHFMVLSPPHLILQEVALIEDTTIHTQQSQDLTQELLAKCLVIKFVQGSSVHLLVANPLRLWTASTGPITGPSCMTQILDHHHSPSAAKNG